MSAGKLISIAAIVIGFALLAIAGAANISILYIPGAISAVIGFAGFFLAGGSGETDENNEMVSIAAFFKQLPFLDDTVLQGLVERAWDVEFTGGEDAEDFVTGEAPLFVAKMGDEMYLINYFDQPYFENVEEVCDETTEMRVKHAIESHTSWISVDRLGVDDATDVAEAYRKIGRLLYQIINEDCTAIAIPSAMTVVPWDEDAEKSLLGDPLNDLCPTNPAVVQVSADDPRMMAAVEEARSRFGEFETAFATREPGQNFSVKSPIEHAGQTEFIWLTVTAIENNIIYGELANEPVDLGGKKLGDRVRVDATQLNDWIFETEDGFEGGFTIKVVSEIAKNNAGG